MRFSINTSRFIRIAAVSCIVACVVEFAAIFIAGAYFANYSQLRGTMSALGAPPSPLGAMISTWWMIMGVVVAVFGYAFRRAFSEGGTSVKLASWILIIYGLGEGIGSGAFKAGHLPTGMSDSAFIHDLLGGVGVAASLILPLVVPKVIRDTQWPSFKLISKIVFFCGIGCIALFLFRFLPDKNNIVSVNEGLFQRLYMLNTYVYFSLIAVVMMRRVRF